MARTAGSRRPRRAHEEPPSGQNASLAGRNRENWRTGPHLQGKIAPGNSHCTPTPLSNSDCGLQVFLLLLTESWRTLLASAAARDLEGEAGPPDSVVHEVGEAVLWYRGFRGHGGDSKGAMVAAVHVTQLLSLTTDLFFSRPGGELTATAGSRVARTGLEALPNGPNGLRRNRRDSRGDRTGENAWKAPVRAECQSGGTEPRKPEGRTGPSRQDRPRQFPLRPYTHDEEQGSMR